MAGVENPPRDGEGDHEVVEGYVPKALHLLAPPIRPCPSTMLRMVPLPRWGRIW